MSEPTLTDGQRAYLAMPSEDDEPRPFVDMGGATGKPCPECLSALEGSPR